MKRPRRDRPVVVVWTEDGVFVPLPRFKKLCDMQFAVHEEIAIIRFEERSMSQHRGYFASVRDAFVNLPEEYDGRWTDEDHFRHWALCEVGVCTISERVYTTQKDARQAAREIQESDPFAQIAFTHDGCGMIVRRAKSQSVPAMGKHAFEDSCRRVIELVAPMSRTTPTELRKNAGRSA